MEPKNVAYDICRHYIRDLRGVDAALFATVDGYRRARDLAALASCSLHFDAAKHNIEDWRALRQIEAFFKKNSIYADPVKCAEAAKNSFLKAERTCASTNLRLEYFYAKRDLLDPDLVLQMSRMERYISSVLGPFDAFLDAMPRLVRVTPGATSHASRRDSLPQLKMRMSLYATSSAIPYLNALYRFYGFNVPRVKVTKSNRVELVPKNYKTSRTIACEPEGNLPFQLAFDTYAKRRLRRKGIDLSDQFRNQRAAKLASVNNDYVTVDFEAASDTVSFNAVAWLFPCDWFKFLCAFRSPEYRGCFGSGKYQKFSSMGNGSTFAIETLIFAAACYATGSRDFLVYGDDVIIGKEFFESYKRLTRFLGFTINASKTFCDGPFRESCGMDAFNGVDVTPQYVRSVADRKPVLCHLVNVLGQIAIMDGELRAYLDEIITSRNLPFVPFQDSTLSGVWIYPGRARQLGILRTRNYVTRYKAYVAKSRTRSFVDSRGYYLWFLNKNSQVLFGGPWVDRRHIRVTETSSVPIFEHTYVRRWVGWVAPSEEIPLYLYWWREPREKRLV